MAWFCNHHWHEAGDALKKIPGCRKVQTYVAVRRSCCWCDKVQYYDYYHEWVTE